MINLKTCNRQEFAIAYKALQKEVKALELRLAEYEGIQTDDDKEAEFQKFWVMYGKKGNVKTTREKFYKLNDKKKSLIFKVVESYVKSTPDKPFRKGAESWLHKECWNDEIIGSDNVKEFHRPKLGAKALDPMTDKLKELAALRAKNTVSVRDRIKLK